MTYYQAEEHAKKLRETYAAMYEAAGKPAFKEYDEFINGLPDGVYNVNFVQRNPMYNVGKTQDGKAYEYPIGIMAWGFGIPEDAYLTESELNEDVWYVNSKRLTYEDW
jgi:hypothetical protein